LKPMIGALRDDFARPAALARRRIDLLNLPAANFLYVFKG
jgi:hypothetical protein